MRSISRFSDIDDEVVYRAEDEADTIAYRPAALTQQTQLSHSQQQRDDPHPPCRRKQQNRRNEVPSTERSTGSDRDEILSPNRGTQDENNAFAALEALVVDQAQTNDDANGSTSGLRKVEDRIGISKRREKSAERRSGDEVPEGSRNDSLYVPHRRSVATPPDPSPTYGLSEAEEENWRPQREGMPLSPSSTMNRAAIPFDVKFVHMPRAQSRETIASRTLLPEKRRVAMLKKNVRVGQTKSNKPSAHVRTTRIKHSIVGSIPQHWNIQKKNSAPVYSFSRRLKPQLPNPLSLASTMNHTSPPSTMVKDTNVPPNASAASIRSPSMSFVPAFLSTPIAVEPPSIDDTDQGCDFGDGLSSELPFGGPLAGSPPRPFASPPAKRRRIGALANRLQKIRTEVLGDVIRFQSGQYPFHGSKTTFDMNDPRCRANSFMDVTVVGDSVVSDEENLVSAKHLHFLGHVHSHTVASVPSNAPCGCLVWLMFTVEAVRALNVRHGSTLRIYNAVPIAVSGPVEWVVTFTELCETYPSNILGALEPTASDILSSLQLHSSLHA